MPERASGPLLRSILSWIWFRNRTDLFLVRRNVLRQYLDYLFHMRNRGVQASGLDREWSIQMVGICSLKD